MRKRWQEANQLLIPSQVTLPILFVPPSREMPKLSAAVEPNNQPMSSCIIAPLPQKNDISIGQGLANGKFQGWGGFIPKDPNAPVEDLLLKEFDSVDKAVTSVINVLLSGTHVEVPDKLTDVMANRTQTTTQDASAKVPPEDESSIGDATDNATEGVSADRPIILGDSSQSPAESVKSAMGMSD